MKRLIVIAMVAMLTGCATEKNAFDIRPEASKNEKPITTVWQEKNRAELDAQTRPEVLAKFVESQAAAEALLAKVDEAYKTDPLILTQIGNVSQLVMCPKCPKAPAARQIWAEAVLKAAENAKDDYRMAFYLDQLRWCGYPNQCDRIAKIGAKAVSQNLKQTVALVIGELKTRK